MPTPNSSNTTTSHASDHSDQTHQSLKPHSALERPFSLFSTLPYYSYYLVIAMACYGLFYDHNPYWPLAILFVGLPLADYISPDPTSPTKEQYKELEKDFWFKVPLFGLILADFLVFFYSLYTFTVHSFPWIYYPGAFFLVGTLTGNQFLIAHEFFHKPTTFDRIFGTLILFKSQFMHFFLEHTYGHHKRVATLEDFATARYRESLYHFLPRALIDGYKTGWDVERRILLKRGHKTPWVIQNRMIWFTTSYIILPIIIFMWLGLKGMLTFLTLAFLSIITLKTIGYIEHYGLLRKKIGPNEYERVNITHSWNAPQRFSNYILFKLQRHSDHHESPYKSYQALSFYNESPVLPHGYALCILTSFFPSMWFTAADRSLKAHNEKRTLTVEEKRQNDWIFSKAVAISSLAFLVLWALQHHANKDFEFL